MLNSYSNPDNEQCAGGHCELIPLIQGPCDNQFEFCLQAVGSSSCLRAPIISQGLEEDEILFTEDDLEQLGISNPLKFFGIPTLVYMFYNTIVVLWWLLHSCSYILTIDTTGGGCNCHRPRYIGEYSCG